jgi:hypothetical protein
MKKPNIRKWLDGFPLAGRGILLATREKRFIISAIIAFLFFGTLMNLLSAGFSKFQLMAALGFSGSMGIIWDSFIGVFGWNRIFMEWLPVFLLALMQGILIGLIVLLWKKKQGQNSANVQRAGIVTGLIALGAGCPTCGTTLIAPLLGTIFSSGASMVGTVSILITVIAIIIAILSLRRLGEETYVIIINERYLKKKEECEQNR